MNYKLHKRNYKMIQNTETETEKKRKKIIQENNEMRKNK